LALLQIAQRNDTDSFQAMVGSIPGACLRIEGLEARWLAPFNDDLRTGLARLYELDRVWIILPNSSPTWASVMVNSSSSSRSSLCRCKLGLRSRDSGRTTYSPLDSSIVTI
jgi:hypothetical protein